MIIGDPTTEGDIGYIEEAFDPISRTDPRLSMPRVLDVDVRFNQLNTVNMTNIDQRAAQVAVANQGLDPTLAGELTTAQQRALQSEANAFHSEALERQREMWMSEARDHLIHVENAAADEISKKNLQVNEQATHAMSEHKSAQIHVQKPNHADQEQTQG